MAHTANVSVYDQRGKTPSPLARPKTPHSPFETPESRQRILLTFKANIRNSQVPAKSRLSPDKFPPESPISADLLSLDPNGQVYDDITLNHDFWRALNRSPSLSDIQKAYKEALMKAPKVQARKTPDLPEFFGLSEVIPAHERLSWIDLHLAKILEADNPAEQDFTAFDEYRTMLNRFAQKGNRYWEGTDRERIAKIKAAYFHELRQVFSERNEELEEMFGSVLLNMEIKGSETLQSLLAIDLHREHFKKLIFENALWDIDGEKQLRAMALAYTEILTKAYRARMKVLLDHSEELYGFFPGGPAANKHLIQLDANKQILWNLLSQHDLKSYEHHLESLAKEYYKALIVQERLGFLNSNRAEIIDKVLLLDSNDEILKLLALADNLWNEEAPLLKIERLRTAYSETLRGIYDRRKQFLEGHYNLITATLADRLRTYDDDHTILHELASELFWLQWNPGENDGDIIAAISKAYKERLNNAVEVNRQFLKENFIQIKAQIPPALLQLDHDLDEFNQIAFEKGFFHRQNRLKFIAGVYKERLETLQENINFIRTHFEKIVPGEKPSEELISKLFKIASSTFVSLIDVDYAIQKIGDEYRRSKKHPLRRT